MSSRVARLCVVVVLVAGFAAPTGAALSADEKRVFFSGDTDRKPSKVAGDINSDDTAYAKAADIPYRTTKPQFSIDGKKLYDYQKRSLNRLDTGARKSRTLPFSKTRDRTLVKDAHVTFLGIHGGAQPRLGTGVGGVVTSSYPMLIGTTGKVLNHADYRIAKGVPKSNYCTSKDYDKDWVDDDGDDLPDDYEYTDGDQSCFKFELHHHMDRWVTVNGHRFSSDSDVIPYSGLSSNSKQTLTVHARITARVERTKIKKDWDPYGAHADDTGSGDWDVTGRSTDADFRKDQFEVTDTQQVLVSDTGSLTVDQTVIEQDGTKHVVLTLTGPSGSVKVTRSQLLDRLLWSYLRLGSSQYIDSTWRTYSMKQYHQTQLHTASGTSTDSSPPHVPRTYLIGLDRRPTIRSSGSASTDADILGYEGYNVDTSQSVQSGVSLEPEQPIVYKRIVITNAPGPVNSLLTLHGQSKSVGVDERVDYRQPEISITEVGGTTLKIHVQDPKTGKPIAGRRVKLFGAQPKSPGSKGYAVTNSKGNAYAKRTNAYVEARVERDSWRHPSGGAFYDKSTTSKTFLPDVKLVSHTHSLFMTMLLVTPLAFMYFYIRQVGVLK